jgi:hypothetical protein
MVDACTLNTVLVLIVATLFWTHIGYYTGYNDYAQALCQADQTACYIANTSNTARASPNCNLGALSNCPPACVRRYYDCLNSITSSTVANFAISQIILVLVVFGYIVYCVFLFMRGKSSGGGGGGHGGQVKPAKVEKSSPPKEEEKAESSSSSSSGSSSKKDS